MYKTVSFSNNDKKEIVETEIHTYRYFDLGQSLADFIPNSISKTATITNGKESFPILQKLKKTLFEFYSECENDKSLYNVKYLLNKLLDNKYSLPRFKCLDNEIVEYRLNTEEGEEKNEIDYMIAVIFELVERKIWLKRCKECGKWFVAYNKIDTIYCPNCSQKRTRQINTNCVLLGTIKKKLKNIRQTYPKECKEYQDTLKYDNEIVINKPNKEATLEELKTFNKWLKTKSKEWFPRKKKNEIRNDEERKYKK